MNNGTIYIRTMQSQLLKTKPRKSPLKSWIVPLTLLAFLVLFLVVLVTNNLPSSGQKDAPTSNTPSFSPATEQEKQEVDTNKGKISPTPTLTPTNSNPTTVDTNKKQVTPIITSAVSANKVVVVRAFVPSAVEDNGTCTIQLRLAGLSQVVASTIVDAFSAGTSTSCEEGSISTSAGNYILTVEYSSQKSYGTSEDYAIEVK
jgi:cytoskeletal protein RodZ